MKFSRKDLVREEYRKAYNELQIENEKLKIQLETLYFKLKQYDEKYSILEDKLKKEKNVSLEREIERIKEENAALKSKISSLKFTIDNDIKHIELETENKKLNSEVNIRKSEVEHLKELLKTYREMPDVKNIIDNLSNLAVPNINELKEFAKVVSDGKMPELAKELSETKEKMDKLIELCCGRASRY